jgi:hypothetical protein
MYVFTLMVLNTRKVPNGMMHVIIRVNVWILQWISTIVPQGKAYTFVLIAYRVCIFVDNFELQSKPKFLPLYIYSVKDLTAFLEIKELKIIFFQ